MMFIPRASPSFLCTITVRAGPQTSSCDDTVGGLDEDTGVLADTVMGKLFCVGSTGDVVDVNDAVSEIIADRRDMSFSVVSRERPRLSLEGADLPPSTLPSDRPLDRLPGEARDELEMRQHSVPFFNSATSFKYFT